MLHLCVSLDTIILKLDTLQVVQSKPDNVDYLDDKDWFVGATACDENAALPITCRCTSPSGVHSFDEDNITVISRQCKDSFLRAMDEHNQNQLVSPGMTATTDPPHEFHHTPDLSEHPAVFGDPALLKVSCGSEEWEYPCHVRNV